MSLVIVWRNPIPPARAERKVRRVVEDQFGTLHLVTDPDAVEFELYRGGGTNVTSRAELSWKASAQ